jgi:Holliday junction resolvasome RuvABC endonuclease subunit
MRGGDKAGSKAVKPLKRGTVRKTPAADAAERIALLEHKLNEALEQQSATSEVLRILGTSV